MAKTHYLMTGSKGASRGRTACGVAAMNATQAIEYVTCQTCRSTDAYRDAEAREVEEQRAGDEEGERRHPAACAMQSGWF